MESPVCEHIGWDLLWLLRLKASLRPLTLLNPIFCKSHLSKPCSIHANTSDTEGNYSSTPTWVRCHTWPVHVFAKGSSCPIQIN